MFAHENSGMEIVDRVAGKARRFRAALFNRFGVQQKVGVHEDHASSVARCNASRSATFTRGMPIRKVGTS